MSTDNQTIPVRGKRRAVRSIPLGPTATVIIKGRFLKVGEVFDEIWKQSGELPKLPDIVARLQTEPGRPDLFTSAQRFPDVVPQHPFYYEWDNLAVASFASHSDWFENQTDRSARKQIRQSMRAGVVTQVVPFTDDLVEGIRSIYNELPVRQGKKFWHYGKDHETVRAENMTYLERSVFIGAFHEDELIGFLKMVLVDDVAALMQILSRSVHFGKRPNNALLSKAIESCEQNGVKHLTYGRLAYGKKEMSSLAEFKKSHGFKRIDLPRYYVPLTSKGRIALTLDLHRGIIPVLPAPIVAATIRLRKAFYSLLRPRP